MQSTSKPLQAYTSGPIEKNYALVEKLCSYIADHWKDQPDLETMSKSIGYSPLHIQKTFSGWAGISPKEFIDALNIHEARKMLQEGESILQASHKIGLSGPSRLHDLFIKREAMTPGAYKSRGKGLILDYGFKDTIFGRSLFIYNGPYLAGLSFCHKETELNALEDMRSRWPRAIFNHAQEEVVKKSGDVLSADQNRSPLKLILIGSDFDISVWEALTHIPMGLAASYTDIATYIGKPQAVRAVASAVGRNPVSYFIPCHRVLRRDGMLGGYHWGLSRKCAILGWERTKNS